MGNQPSHPRQRNQDNAAGPAGSYPPASIYNHQTTGQAPFHAPQQPAHNPYLPQWTQPDPRYPRQQQQQQQQYVGYRGPPPPPNRPPQSAAVAPLPIQKYNQTKTIRNTVNIDKKSIRLVPLPDEPHKLQITFAFDATESCIVYAMVGATENEQNGNELKPTKQPAAPCIAYSAGLKLQFPKAGDPTAFQQVIDTSLFEDAELTASTEVQRPAGQTGDALRCYPLAIRMEATGPSAFSEGRSLSSHVPGAPQPKWLHSQTNLAVLFRDDHQCWHVKTVSQKLLVEGTQYDVLDIYGVDHSTHKDGTSDEDNEDRLCVICLVNERNTTVLPCRHMCMCDECAQELRKQDHKCPICRVTVSSLLHIKHYNSDRKMENDPAAQGGLSGPALPARAALPPEVAVAGSAASRGAALMKR